MSTTNISTAVEDLLKAFDLLPEPERHQVASEILRRACASPKELDEAQVAALYAEFAEADRNLAEEGIEEYGIGLVSEDAFLARVVKDGNIQNGYGKTRS